jgi:hypothetical protein
MSSTRYQRMHGRSMIALTACTLVPLVAHAEWYHREEAIMGTSVGSSSGPTIRRLRSAR